MTRADRRSLVAALALALVVCRRPDGRLFEQHRLVPDRDRRRPAPPSRSTAASTRRPPTLWSRRSSKDGGQREGPQRRRGRAGPADRPGGLAFAGRRPLHRELAPADVAAGQGPAGAGRCGHAGRGAGRVQLAQGDWVGVSARVSTLVYDTSALQPSDLPTSVLGLADPKWKGKLGLAPGETDFQPIVTSIIHAKGTAAALTWLKAVKAQRREPHLPRQRDPGLGGQQGPGRAGSDQLLLLVPAAQGGGGVGHALGRRHLRPSRSRLRPGRVRCRGHEVLEAPDPGPAVRGLPGQRRGPVDPGALRQLRVPAAHGHARPAPS